MSSPQKENICKKKRKSALKRSGIRKRRKDVFITRLRMLLDDPNITTVSWHPSGKAVMVDKRYISTQVKTLFPECFGEDKFTSIRQNLGAHGFKSACKRQNMNDGIWKKYNHVLNSNRFLHIYEHPLFRRDKPENDKLIKRIPIQRKEFNEKLQQFEVIQNDDKDHKSKYEEVEISDEDRETETARLNTDQQTSEERLRWKFYSADEEDYKVREHRAGESDESQTPVAEEDKGESRTSTGDAREKTDPSPTEIRPVQDLESPVLGEIEDPVMYSTNEDQAKWEREKKPPGIQASSIWKPMTSPLGDPKDELKGAQAEKIADKTAAKRCETPVDLSTREKIKAAPRKRMIKKTAKPVALEVANTAPVICQNSEDDDVPDEETCSTLAAFCQAKVTALYGGIMDEAPGESKKQVYRKEEAANQQLQKTTVQRQTEVKRNPLVLTKVAYQLPQMIRIGPPTAKKIRFAKPNKVKINLSMPLCSRIQQTAKNEAVTRTSFTSKVKAPVNQTKMMWANPATVLETASSQSLKTEFSMTDTGNTRNTNVSTKTAESVLRSKENIPNQVNTTAPLKTNALAETAQISHQIPDESVLSAPEIPPSSAKSITPFERTPINQFFFVENSQPGCDEELLKENIPIAAPGASTGTTASEINHKENIPDEPMESAPVATNNTYTMQKLPSIDQIFKPLPLATLVSTPTVAANVEVASLSAPRQKSKTHFTQNNGGAFIPPGYEETAEVQTKDLAGRGRTNQRCVKKNHTVSKTPTTLNDGQTRSPAQHRMNPYMYPYPQNPGYMRWPGPYPWPPYMPLAGRYHPYYQCPVPNFSTYQR